MSERVRQRNWFLAKRFMDRDHWHAVKMQEKTPNGRMVSYCGVERRPKDVQVAQLDYGMEPLEVEGQRICRDCRRALGEVAS